MYGMNRYKNTVHSLLGHDDQRNTRNHNQKLIFFCPIQIFSFVQNFRSNCQFCLRAHEDEKTSFPIYTMIWMMILIFGSLWEIKLDLLNCLRSLQQPLTQKCFKKAWELGIRDGRGRGNEFWSEIRDHTHHHLCVYIYICAMWFGVSGTRKQKCTINYTCEHISSRYSSTMIDSTGQRIQGRE